MASSQTKQIARHKEAIRVETLRLLTNEASPFEQRIIDLVCGHELPRYDWITSHSNDVDRNDKRLALLRKIAASDMAVFLYSKFSNYGANGNGIVVCQLDPERPWSVETAERSATQSSRLITPADVVLRAHPRPNTATAFFHKYAESRDYVAGTDVSESPGVVKVDDPVIDIILPKDPSGVENFATRLHHLGSVAGYGARGVLDLSKHVAVTDKEPTAQVTLLHAALRHYSGDESWRYA